MKFYRNKKREREEHQIIELQRFIVYSTRQIEVYKYCYILYIYRRLLVLQVLVPIRMKMSHPTQIKAVNTRHQQMKIFSHSVKIHPKILR